MLCALSTICCVIWMLKIVVLNLDFFLIFRATATNVSSWPTIVGKCLMIVDAWTSFSSDHVIKRLFYTYDYLFHDTQFFLFFFKSFIEELIRDVTEQFVTLKIFIQFQTSICTKSCCPLIGWFYYCSTYSLCFNACLIVNSCVLETI